MEVRCHLFEGLTRLVAQDREERGPAGRMLGVGQAVSVWELGAEQQVHRHAIDLDLDQGHRGVLDLAGLRVLLEMIEKGPEELLEIDEALGVVDDQRVFATPICA